MGSSSSKFKKYLQHGDEYAAMQVRHRGLLPAARVAIFFLDNMPKQEKYTK
jgi:hypothetical protein